MEQSVEPVITDESRPADIGKAARQGGLWSIIGYAFSKITSFASSIVVARVLAPEQFGLVAMTNTVLAMVQILGILGLAAAIIHQRDDIDEYANTGWWMDVICGICLFILSNAVAPFAALYYHEPQVRLIIFVASFNYLINPIGTTMDVLLRRDLRFKTSTKITLVQGLLVAVFTIVLALAGAGVWSFVYPHIIAGIVVVVLRWKLSWFRPRLKVKWSLAAKLWHFGRNVFGSGIFDYVNQNVDYVLVGGLMGGRLLGLYTFAYGLGTWIVTNITGTISSMLFPTIASVQNDPDRARHMFLRLMTIISLVGFPVVCIQWALAPLFIGSVYGTKWLDAVTAFRLISIYGMGRAVCSPALTLISAMGRPDVNFKVSAAMSPILISAIYLGSRHGINGVAFATAMANGVFVWLYVLIPFKTLAWNPIEAVKAIIPALTSSLAAGILTWLAYLKFGQSNSSLLVLLILGLFGLTIYIAVVRVIFRDEYNSAVKLIKTTMQEARN